MYLFTISLPSLKMIMHETLYIMQLQDGSAGILRWQKMPENRENQLFMVSSFFSFFDSFHASPFELQSVLLPSIADGRVSNYLMTHF